MSGDGAAGSGPEKLAALFREARTDATGSQTNIDSGKEFQRI